MSSGIQWSMVPNNPLCFTTNIGRPDGVLGIFPDNKSSFSDSCSGLFKLIDLNKGFGYTLSCSYNSQRKDLSLTFHPLTAFSGLAKIALEIAKVVVSIFHVIAEYFGSSLSELILAIDESIADHQRVDQQTVWADFALKTLSQIQPDDSASQGANYDSEEEVSLGEEKTTAILLKQRNGLNDNTVPQLAQYPRLQGGIKLLAGVALEKMFENRENIALFLQGNSPENLSNALWEILTEIKSMTPVTSANVRCRFRNIVCPLDTVVSAGDLSLHANWVGAGLTERKMIASQAPLFEDMSFFWKMVCENSAEILDLTSVGDRNLQGPIPPIDSVRDYAPTSTETPFEAGNRKITLTETQQVRRFSNQIVRYTYEVVDSRNASSTEISRIHCSSWPDRGLVSIEQLDDLVDKLLGIEGTAWVHCKAGVSRTGLVIAGSILKERIQSGKITKNNLPLHLLEIVLVLRDQRGPELIQLETQFDLLVRYANFLLDTVKA